MEKIKLNYDDVMIVPEVTSRIKSRSECKCWDDNAMLPIFAAPMNTVVDEASMYEFLNRGIYVVVPRTIDLDIRKKQLFNPVRYFYFVAVSISEFEDIFVYNKGVCDDDYNCKQIRVCIDIANGHMEDILELVKKAKSLHDNICVMAGNIANPKTFIEYENAGIDYCRVGIGTGSGCLTSSNTGIHFPQFSLLEEIYKIKLENKCKCKIVADGGIRGYRDIQKALIFADYVMIGGLFNKAIESAGKIKYGNFYMRVFGKKVLNPLKTLLYKGKSPRRITRKLKNQMKGGYVDLYKEFYGMSTKKAQLLINESSKPKTSEGIIKTNKVEFTLSDWINNEISYLKSAMSYTNSVDLDEYKGSSYVVLNGISYNN